MKAAFEHIVSLETKTLERHIALTEIEAPPFKEEKRATVFAEYYRDLGMDSVWIDSEGNVLGLLLGSEGKQTVALDAHLDTVFPEGTNVEVKIQNDTLFAPGIGDDTRGLSMILTILETIKANNIQPKNNLLFVGSVGEEGLGDLRGVKHLFRENGPQIDSWIAIDGGNIGRVNNKGLGSYRYRVTFEGPGGHSWGTFGLGNPHHAMGEAIGNFVRASDIYTEKGPKTSYNVGVVSGGTSINSIPFESIMEIDIRSIEPKRLDAMEVILKEAVKKALAHQNDLKRQGPDLTVKIDKIGNRPSGELSDTLPLIQRTLAATTHFGAEPFLTRGSTNSNIPITKGIPSVTIGRGGNGGKAHSLGEWWVNEEGYKAIQLALLIVLSETGIN
ncbi:M20/M25/M40 family metallo-hydrolase [Flavobacteriaceae bacterium]|nr:M20/M25/M40 family metallo-hydrolase [Flavobacteriaceae bacterium]MDB4062497.1 M20/M25/M40 family metallo-hydrolase [Flavobacteriaceae bacterium]MDB4255059.1 M20/M25/M40 family metallo-hydrolase [Flavobacteriaceae bacterium]MDC0000990.1 M20/M25/M40 family metallo-hydrolase [Flavobacteriaceae bacterium]